MDLSFPYTHNNHFKFGYHSGNQQDAVEWYACPLGREDHEWVVQFDMCRYYPSSFREECHRAARLIVESSDEVPNIMFSGGAESEIVVRAFHDQGLPFKVSIMQFRKNLNLHDIAFAVAFCEQRKIPYETFWLDIEDFWEFEVYNYAGRTQCCSPQLPPTMWLADQMDGLPIMGSGEPYVRKVVPDDYVPGESPYEPSEWVFEEKERIQAWYRHFFNQQRPAVPGFFQYTPELMYAFLTNPVVNELVDNKRVGKLSTVSTKSEFYYTEYPDMIRRPKFHGFEKVMDADEVVREVLMDTYEPYNRVGGFEYHKFVDDMIKALDR